MTDDVGDSFAPKAEIRATENVPRTVRCVVIGGFPPPNLAVHVGQRDVTADFRFRSRANVTGSRGLRLIQYRSERWSESVVAQATDNGDKVQCVATVPGLKPVVAEARLDVQCEL